MQSIKKENKKSKVINQWHKLNEIIRLKRIKEIILYGLCAFLLLVISQISLKPPLVVVKECSGDETYHIGSYIPHQIGEETVKKVATRFIKQRYAWDDLNPDTIALNISPLSTEGLKKKVKNNLVKLRDQNFKDKSVEQSVTNIEVLITKDNVMATFDKILKIEGLPLPVPTLIYLNVIKGASTVWNPEGLYVNGIIEQQGN